MKNKKVFISAVGSYLPNKVLTNFDLEKTVDTTNNWIIERTGIEKRHVVQENELTSDLCYQASIKALKSANLKSSDIDMIVVATTTPDLTFPATAIILQKKLNANNAFAFDVQAVCAGFVYALNIAKNFISSGQVKNALVIGADCISKIVDWNDRGTCILFGDGAGAVILESEIRSEEYGQSEIIDCEIRSDGNLTEILKTTSGVCKDGNAGFIKMEGKEVFKHAVEKMSESISSILKRNNYTIDDVKYLIPHQANLRILSAIAKKLNFPESKVIKTVNIHANTSAASIPLALDYAVTNNMIKRGDLIVFEALGGGLAWGGALFKW